MTRSQEKESLQRIFGKRCLDLTLKQAVAELAAAEANYDLVAAGTPAEQKAAISAANFNLIAAQQALNVVYDGAGLASALALREVIVAQKSVDDAHRFLTGLTSSANQSSIDAAYATIILAGDNLDDAKDAYEPVGKTGCNMGGF